MQWKQPKNNDKYQWTQHSLFKMQFYALSAQKILGVIKRPARKEEGIVKNTVAVMQPINPKIQNGKKIWKQEVWVMYQLRNSGAISKSQFPIFNKSLNPKLKNYKLPTTNYKLHPVKSSLMRGAALPQFNRVKIISAWRYPGISPEKNPIPEDILAEIEEII